MQPRKKDEVPLPLQVPEIRKRASYLSLQRRAESFHPNFPYPQQQMLHLDGFFHIRPHYRTSAAAFNKDGKLFCRFRLLALKNVISFGALSLSPASGAAVGLYMRQCKG